MAWNIFDRPVQNADGDLQLGVGVPVAVYNAGGGIALLKGDVDGITPKSNPFTSDPVTGRATFYAQGGRYQVVINEGQYNQSIWPDILLGSAAGLDVDEFGNVIYTGVASGIRSIFSTTITAGDPGPGNWRVNNLTFASITQIRIDDLQAGDSAPLAAWLDSLDDRATTNGRSILRAEVINDPLKWAEWLVTGSVANSSGYRTITVTPLAQSGWPFTNGVLVGFTRGYVGNPGADGRDPGVLMTWETAVTDAAPAAGGIRANNANVNAATFLFISQTGRFGAPLLTWLNTLDDSTSVGVKGQLVLTDAATNAQSMFNVTGPITVASGYVKVPVSDAGGVTAFTNGNPISVQFTRAGDAGNASVPVPFTTADRIVSTVGAGTQMKQSGAWADATGNYGGAASYATQANVEGVNVDIIMRETDAAADGRVWGFHVNSLNFYMRVLNDAMNAQAFLWQVLRTAGSNVLGLCNFPSGLQSFGQQVLTIAGNLALTGGFWTSSFSLGTIASGTVTPSPHNRNIQHYNNNGAHTLAPNAAHHSLVLDVTNGASAGVVTRSGFTKVTGDTMTTTVGKKYRHFITVGDAGSHCHTQEIA